MKKSIMFLGLALALSVNALATNSGVVKYYDPLCIAISKNDIQTAKKIIEYGADVNESYKGMTPLMYAARYNNLELFKMLLQKGADLSVKDSRGNTAISYAQMSKATDIIEFLSAKNK